MSGTVSRRGVPTITLSVAQQDRVAVIDTGFNGDLELPDSLHASLNARLVGRVSSALGGGQTIAEDVYLVDFPFDERTVRAHATFVPGTEILVGTGLLRDFRLEVDFADSRVQLDRVR